MESGPKSSPKEEILEKTCETYCCVRGLITDWGLKGGWNYPVRSVRWDIPGLISCVKYPNGYGYKKRKKTWFQGVVNLIWSDPGLPFSDAETGEEVKIYCRWRSLSLPYVEVVLKEQI